jgi:hypothetical protein
LDFVPEKSAIDITKVIVTAEAKEMLAIIGMESLPVQLEEKPRKG